MAYDNEPVDVAAHERRWRRIRTSATLLVLVGIVVGAAWYGWHNALDQDKPAATTSEGPCAPGSPTAAPKPADVRVNVYNATTRSGLAAAVARQLRQRGFNVVSVDNDPLGRNVSGVGEVRANPDQQAAANLVASLLPGAPFVPDDRSGPAVDLVLGDTFKALAEPGAEPTGPSDLPACPPAQ